MYIQGNFGSKTLLYSFKRRKGWESETKQVKMDFWKSVWAEDPNLRRAWADFKLKPGFLRLCPVVSDTSKDKDCAFHSLCPFSSLWPPSQERFSFLTSKQISLSAFCVCCLNPLLCTSKKPLAPFSLWPYAVEYSSYFSSFPSLKGPSKHSYEFSHMSCLHHC